MTLRHHFGDIGVTVTTIRSATLTHTPRRLRRTRRIVCLTTLQENLDSIEFVPVRFRMLANLGTIASRHSPHVMAWDTSTA